MKKYIIIVLAIVVIFVMGARTANEFVTRGVVSKTEGVRYIASLNSSNNLYMILYSPVENKTWDVNAGAYGAADSVTHANAAITLTDHRAHGVDGWRINIPTGLFNEDGGFDVKFYDNATPAASDAILLGRWINIRRGVIQSMNDL